MRVEKRLVGGEILNLGRREAGFLRWIGQDVEGVLVNLVMMFSCEGRQTNNHRLG